MFKDIAKTIEQAKKEMNPNYAFHCADVMGIYEHCQGEWMSLIYYSHCIGFMQGYKAAKRELKKAPIRCKW